MLSLTNPPKKGLLGLIRPKEYITDKSSFKLIEECMYLKLPILESSEDSQVPVFENTIEIQVYNILQKKKGIIDQVMGDGEYSDTFATELLKNLL